MALSTETRYINIEFFVSNPILKCPGRFIDMSQTTWFYKDMLAELFSRVWESRCLTMSDRWGLSRALLSCSLDLEDLAAIDRIVHAVRRGWLSCAN